MALWRTQFYPRYVTANVFVVGTHLAAAEVVIAVVVVIVVVVVSAVAVVIAAAAKLRLSTTRIREKKMSSLDLFSWLAKSMQASKINSAFYLS